MTFETEEGAVRAKNYNEIVENNSTLQDIKLWLGRKLEFARASEPSDVIWENRYLTPWDRKKKSIVIWTIISLVLLGSFTLMTMIMNQARHLKKMYPPIECQSLAMPGNESLTE